MCDFKPQGYKFQGIYRELAKREAEAIYKFDGMLEVIRVRTYEAKLAKECLECREHIRYVAQAQMAAVRGSEYNSGLIGLGMHRLAGMGSPFGGYQ